VGQDPGLSQLRRALLADERVAAHDVIPARTQRTAPLPEDLPAAVGDALARSGIEQLHAFQRDAIDALRAGRHVVLGGGTGAGKSLCYQAVLLEALLTPRAASDAAGAARKQTALYLAPTKALAQDQARRLRELGASWARPMLYDGDTEQTQRAQIRRDANLLLTNPDMLSQGILPAHAHWSTFLRGLAIVVLDESHVYRGVFGSNVAHVMRRLRRLLAHYGNHHAVFCLSSATIANAAEHAQLLCALDDVDVIGDAGAPVSARDVVLWNPEFDEELEERDSAIGEAAKLYVQLLEAGAATIVFCRTRTACELVHVIARDMLTARGREDIAQRIAPYRAGYTPEERRRTEQQLASGALRGVVATSALELGIDIGSLEASIVVTFPGTVTSLRQRWGRAARSADARGLCVLVGGDDALDQYFMRHPRELLARPVEHAVVSVRNARIAAPQLLAAAAELPLGAEPCDDALWPSALRLPIEQELIASGCARRTPKGVAFIGSGHAAGMIALRSMSLGDVTIIDGASGQLLGTVDIARAATTVHSGAVYLHRGERYLVRSLDTQLLEAIVEPRTMPYYTRAKLDTQIEVLGVSHEHALDGSDVVLRFGQVLVTDQLAAYQRINAQTHTPIDLVEQHLPPVAFDTEAVWFAAPAAITDALDPAQLLGALHAAEHALIALLPLLAMCDRWDIGGLSIDWHEAFEGPGIFVYDGHPGGIGIAQQGAQRFTHWLRTTRDAVASCPCEHGCPSCVQSPKCGNLNEPLDKAGAVRVLDALLGAAAVVA
jgi:DEAD/DEAH box helicase domain-containing protein